MSEWQRLEPGTPGRRPNTAQALEASSIPPRIRDILEKASIPEPNSGCWLWLAGVNRHGYGWINLGNGRGTFAHRVSYALNVAPIPAGAHVLHKCDNTYCVNPDHLFLGTHADNMADKARKGRLGAINRKLTVADVREILTDRRSLRIIARDYGVAAPTIGLIKRGVAWKHVQRPA